MTTASSGLRCLISRNSASPSIPGMLMSERITISSGPSSIRRRNPSSPEAAKCNTYCPWRTSRRKRWRKSSGRSGSSSTIRMLNPISVSPLAPPARSKNPPVEDGIGRGAFDLDDPEIRVAPTLAGDIGIGVGLDDGSGAGGPHPQQFAILPAGLGKYRAAVVAAVELDQHRARIAVAPRHHRNRDGGEIATPDQCLDPYPGFEPRFHAGTPGSAASAPARGQRQPDMNPQPLRNPALGRDRAAHRLDVAPRDPQPDPEIGCRRFIRDFVRRVAAALGVVAFEDALELLLGHARAAVRNSQMCEAAVMGQMDQDLAARWRERDGVVDQI